MRHGGRLLRFWVPVFGLAVGLQSISIPAQSDGLKSIGTLDEASFRLTLLIKDVTGDPRDKYVIQVNEVSAEKEEPSAAKVEASAEKDESSAEKAGVSAEQAGASAEKQGSTTEAAGVSAEKAETSAEKEDPSSEKEADSAEKLAVPAERERDHGARSPQEMLAWFLKGAAALTAMVLFYKGLKWWVLRRRQSE